jgi:hypothetical protein
MVFKSEEIFEELDCNRYSTLAEAKKGHKEIVNKWSKE